MKRIAFALCLLASGVQSALGTCPTYYAPVRPAAYYAPPVTYSPAPTYVAPAPTYVAPAPVAKPAGFQVLVATLAVPLIDYAVKDVFVFTGPPLAIPVSVQVGVSGAGAPALSAIVPLTPPPGPPTRPRDDSLSRALAEDGAADPGPLASRGDTRAPPSGSRESLLAKVVPALRTSCFECHGGGKTKGELALFGPSGELNPVKWSNVLTAVSAPMGRAPDMPPEGRAPLAAEVVEAIWELARLEGG